MDLHYGINQDFGEEVLGITHTTKILHGTVDNCFAVYICV